MSNNMPLFTKVKYLYLLTLVLITSVIFYSCKKDDDNPVEPPVDDPAAIAVTSPSSGDTVLAFSSFEIQWQTNLTGGKVKIEFSDDNGATWILITPSTENNGSFIWSPVPDSISFNCRIKISTLDNTVSDINDGVFQLVQDGNRLLSLIKPNGGEFLFSGESYNITWVSNDVNQIKIEFSSDNGAVWNIITPNYPADSGYYSWNPIPNLSSVSCLVKISDVNDSLIDLSSSVFTIGQPKKINVVAPNGGEEWPAKSSKVITWNSSQVANVKIEYSSNNGVDWVSIIENTESDGYYIWDPLPNIPSTNAKIRITNVDSGIPSDASDAVFTVAPEEALSIVEPNGGEQWLAGSNQYIRWNGNSTNKRVKGKVNDVLGTVRKTPLLPTQVENVKLEYTTNSGSSWTLIAEDVPNNGVYTWNSIPAANSTLCKVRISDMQDGTPYDLSDSAFTIYNSIQQELAVTSPNGGEIWQAGTTQSLTWTSTGVTNVKIEYTINNGLNWVTITNSTPSDGFFSWDQVPNSASTICRIKISDAEDNFPSDFSNAVFTIAPEPEITVVSPNGGESIQANSTTNITWTSTNISHVRLEYTTNNGAGWTEIINSTPSDGLFEWEGVPDISSALCRVRISDVYDGQPYDISNGNFTITNKIVQSIILVTPNNNESWETGTTHDIIWTGTAIDSVKIEFTSNNGTTWTTIAAGAPGSGSVEWSVPTDIIPEDANSILCRIRVSDAGDGMPVDESNTPVTIKRAQSIRVIYPNGGEYKVAGDTINIQWDAKGIEKVKIEFTINNSLVEEGWFVLATDVPSGGSNGHLVASFSIPTDECRIRISDASDGTPIDASDGVFIVAPQPKRTIAVTSPKDGDDWLVGYTQEIRWQSTNVERVKLEYTLNGGADWKIIASDVPSNGLYNWLPPSIDFRSDVCRLRVTSVTDTSLYDISDGYFSLFGRMLRVVFPNGGERINPWDSDSPTDTVIQWTSAGLSNVRIEYSLNGGVSWSVIANNVPSTGAYRWTYPQPDITSSLGLIRITDVSADAGTQPLNDISDTYFYLNVRRPGLSIVNPGKFQAGSSISWYGSEDIQKVNLEYSVDGGNTWRVFASNVQHKPRAKNNYIIKAIPGEIKRDAMIRIIDASGKYKSENKKITVH